MPEVSVSEAKTHLPKLLEYVEKGERFIITKHGRPVAELVPATRHDAEIVRKAIQDLRIFRQALDKRGIRLRDLLQEGETRRDLTHQGHRY
jgi:prevent-host-death family protein